MNEDAKMELNTGVTVWILNETTGCLEPDRVVYIAGGKPADQLSSTNFFFPNLLELDC